MQLHDSHPRILASALAIVGLLASASAHATLIGDEVDITFASFNDNFFTSPLTDNNVTVVDPGNEIQTGDSTGIGGSGTPLLSKEFLDIQGDRIILQLEAGGVDGNGNLTTGYSADAFWEIGDLNFDGGSITGFNLILRDITNFTAADVDFSGGNTFRILISNLWIADGESDIDTGQIELELLTIGTPPPPVPEPGMLALLGFGLVAMAGARRRRTR